MKTWQRHTKACSGPYIETAKITCTLNWSEKFCTPTVLPLHSTSSVVLICSEHWDRSRNVSYYPQPSGQGGSKPDPSFFFMCFKWGSRFSQSGSNPHTPPIFSLLQRCCSCNVKSSASRFGIPKIASVALFSLPLKCRIEKLYWLSMIDACTY